MVAGKLIPSRSAGTKKVREVVTVVNVLPAIVLDLHILQHLGIVASRLDLPSDVANDSTSSTLIAVSTWSIFTMQLRATLLGASSSWPARISFAERSWSSAPGFEVSWTR